MIVGSSHEDVVVGDRPPEGDRAEVDLGRAVTQQAGEGDGDSAGPGPGDRSADARAVRKASDEAAAALALDAQRRDNEVRIDRVGPPDGLGQEIRGRFLLTQQREPRCARSHHR